MIKILSLPLWWRVKSDAEYIETVRKYVRIGKKAAVFFIVVSLLCGLAAIWVGNMVLKSFSEGHGFSASEIAPGMALGLLVGGISGFFLFVAVLELGLAMSFVFGYRTEKLLLKYYDLASRPKSNE
jgi:H+/Cl- antiporter ClcA